MDAQPILPDARVADLSARGLWPDRLLIDALDGIAAGAPDALAIVDHNSMTGRSTRMGYGTLRSHSLRLAAALAAHGVGRGDVVAVQLPNWWHHAAFHLACVRIGAVINPLMPVFRERELQFMLGFAEARVLVVPRLFRGFDYPAMAAGLRSGLPHLAHVFVVGGDDPATSVEACLLDRPWEAEVDVDSLFRARRPDANDVTEIMYTSGTTGQPKGVMHTSNTLACKALLANQLFGFRRGDCIYMGSPLAHQTGFMYGMCLAIHNGAPCVLQDIWDPIEAARLIAAERCTITVASTPFLADLVHTRAEHRHDASSLRLFMCAGAPIPRVLVAAARRSHPGLYVMSGWGMTEMGIATATYPGDPDEKVIETDGRGLPHQQVRVVDADGAVVAPGIEGRLQARCATSFVGYLKRPDAYGVDGDGWLETGDNARMDADGYIRITGRSKDIIIRGGENIPVVEVEELLYRHPAVEDAAIVAMPDPRLGERACAFVTLRPGHALDFRGMIDHLAAARMMKQYLPERLEIIDAFPRTPSGKIQKFRLRERARTLTAHRDDNPRRGSGT
ncbi:AMP-binding protein [Vineibacter terrae]|uniref:AMP-binding protein n=1 Tax=Vineibacter terrae TaxID=2586908 RepID=UPI002E3391C2|nr:AMP-binding protein [Vineibacter terrae]HEX2886218.1 AMP-binding protein [Vineibacter terrae]